MLGDDLVVEDGLVERHRQLVLGLEADRGVELVGIFDQRQVHHPHRDALVGDAEANLLGQLVLAEQRAQRRGHGLGVDDLAVVDGPRRQVADRPARDARRAVAAQFHGGDTPGFNVQAYNRARLFCREHLLINRIRKSSA